LALVVFTYNVANGLTAGLILHPLLKLLTGRFRELNLGIVVLAAICVAYYVVGLPH
jgi:AGZA family xanthine/uracil permease-like MFS transporter